LVISCEISGTGGFLMKGGLDGPGVGRLFLNGTNTYTGPTTINLGRLYVNGVTAAASAVTLGSSCFLGGTGVISGPVTVPAGAILSPGVATALGTLTVSNNLSLGGEVVIKVNKSLARSNDMISVSGALTRSGVATLHVLNFGPPLQT